MKCCRASCYEYKVKVNRTKIVHIGPLNLKFAVFRKMRFKLQLPKKYE